MPRKPIGDAAMSPAERQRRLRARRRDAVARLNREQIFRRDLLNLIETSRLTGLSKSEIYNSIRSLEYLFALSNGKMELGDENSMRFMYPDPNDNEHLRAGLLVEQVKDLGLNNIQYILKDN